MINRWACILALSLAWVSFSGGAMGYEFWGIGVGMETFSGSSQLAFSGVAQSGAQYVVGGYEYTRVDNTWLGPFPAAAPGEGYLASRRSDAQGLFFRADNSAARFVLITGAAQSGLPATEVGTGPRLFGPGDLRIDLGGRTYGVGLRQSGLLWAVDPLTTNPEYMIWHNGEADSIYARDAGTVGKVELDPRWDRVGHSALPADSDMASAFYVSGSGSAVGSATVDFRNTGLYLCGARVYAYEIAVPWSVLGLKADESVMQVSWRPDCGNDILSCSFWFDTSSCSPDVPEPSTLAGMLTGVIGLIGAIGRKS